MKYMVKYRIPQMTGEKEHAQGPFERDQADAELRDIAGYEGVENVYLDPVLEGSINDPDWE